jgi:antitoxin MazE
MICKIIRIGNDLMLSLPQDVIEILGAEEGSNVHVIYDRGNNRVIIQAVNAMIKETDETFVRQVNEFIEEYRPALERLAHDDC